MDRPSLGAYVEPAIHEAISDIIRRHSSNPLDVRDETLQGIDLSGATRILDLGCGFGFMEDALVGKLPPDAEITGVDMHESNREAFLARGRAAARSARFICEAVDSELRFPTGSFDAVIASYSLYFFPRIVPEVARVVQPDGVFVSLTHSESHFHGMLEAIGASVTRSPLHALLAEFSAECGADRLAAWFGTIEVRPYPNTLVFRAEDLDEFLALVRFKLPSLVPAASGPERVTDLLTRAHRLLLGVGTVTIEKDDAGFVCREPRIS
jgi:SAM-dependent methyltransferase